MKYLKLFNQHTDYETFKASQDYIEPNVSYCISENEVHYNPITPVTHEYVDLGLPSGTLWATTNIGATNPEDSGDCFAWGETETKEDYSWSTYKYGRGANFTKYNQTDGLTELELEDDAAHVLWGDAWVIPTKTQWYELNKNCTWSWGTVNGITGYTVSGNGNSIFLPVDESDKTYWTSELFTAIGDYNAACYEILSSNNHNVGDMGYRNNGYLIRPVITPTQGVA